MGRYIVERRPATADRAECFAVIDTATETERGRYPDAAAAAEQCAHLNHHPGMAVGAPITPDTPPWSPLDND